MPRLVINPGTNSAWEVQLKQGINRLGRGFDNDFKLEHSSVSGSHCQIVVDSGNVLIKDLGSTNGTFVNRAPVTEAPLQPGQTIHLGGVELLYTGDPPANTPVGATEFIPRPTAPPPAPAPRLSISAQTPAYAGAAPPSASAAPHTEVPPPPQPAAASATPRYFSGKGPCKFHPKTPARYHCGKCHLFYCDLCITVRSVGEEQHKFCRKCGTELMNVQVAGREAPKSFFKRLPGVFAYPFKGSGLFVVIVCTIVISALEFMSGMFSFFAFIVCYGYMFAFMQNIIHSTASEDEELPSWPSMDDLGGGFTKFAACVVMSFGVPLGLFIYGLFQEEEATTSMSLMVPLMALGCFYFPMALLAVAMKDTPIAANPLIVLPAILKAPLEYLVAVILMGMVVAMRYGGKYVLDLIFGPHSLTTHSMGELFAIFGARSLWQFVAVYLLAVNMRILGLLYVAKKDRLGWFGH